MNKIVKDNWTVDGFLKDIYKKVYEKMNENDRIKVNRICTGCKSMNPNFAKNCDEDYFQKCPTINASLNGRMC